MTPAHSAADRPRTTLSSLVACLACVASLGCDPQNEIHVEPGSTARRLVLHAFRSDDSVNGLRTVTRISVGRCGSGAQLGPDVWTVERTRHRWFAPDEPTRFAYGQLPGGEWTTTRPAAPLDTGCYYLTADGGAIGTMAFFRFTSDGSTEVVPDSVWYARQQQWLVPVIPVVDSGVTSTSASGTAAGLPGDSSNRGSRSNP